MDYDSNKIPVSDISNNSKIKERIIYIIGAIILIAAGFYFIFYNKRENTDPASIGKPVITGVVIIGQVVSVDNVAKNISMNASASGKNYIISISPSAVMVKVKAVSSKITKESKASFSDLAEGQNVSVIYEKGDSDGNTILAKKIEIIEFTPPPVGSVGANYPKTPPGE